MRWRRRTQTRPVDTLIGAGNTIKPRMLDEYRRDQPQLAPSVINGFEVYLQFRFRLLCERSPCVLIYRNELRTMSALTDHHSWLYRPCHLAAGSAQIEGACPLTAYGYLCRTGEGHRSKQHYSSADGSVIANIELLRVPNPFRPAPVASDRATPFYSRGKHTIDRKHQLVRLTNRFVTKRAAQQTNLQGGIFGHRSPGSGMTDTDDSRSECRARTRHGPVRKSP